MDYLIKNGWIVNGKNEKPFYGEIAIKDGKIEEIGSHIQVPSDFPSEYILDAAGGYVTPGFIDIHRHGDWQAFGNGDDELLNRQGLTTVVNGNCGLSVAPAGEKFTEEIAGFLSSVTGTLPVRQVSEAIINCDSLQNAGNSKNHEGFQNAGRLKNYEGFQNAGSSKNHEDFQNAGSSKNHEGFQNAGSSKNYASFQNHEKEWLAAMSSMKNYMDALSRERRSVNTGMLAGNGTIRAGVKGYAPGKLSREEVRQVWKTLEDSLAAGALGVSLGIAYAPEFEYDRDGLVEALQPLKGTSIPITTHIRNEGDGILLALKEVIAVAKELQIPLHVSHLKCIGQKNWKETPRKIIALFDQAAGEGVKIDFDLYPYLTGSTQLVHLLPPQFQEGGTEMICRRLQDFACRREITKVLKEPSDIFENIVELAGFDRIYASTLHTEKLKEYAGQSIATIAKLFGKDPYEMLYDILLEEKCQVTMLDTIASEEDMLYFLKDDRANLISDAIYPAGGRYHPRVYGAFPKMLTDYVREKKIFSIEEAIYKMTARPAEVLGLKRGVLEKGMPADLNIFHLDQLQVRADFRNPDQYCTGFDYVLVGGKIAVDHDVYRNSESGKVIKR